MIRTATAVLLFCMYAVSTAVGQELAKNATPQDAAKQPSTEDDRSVAPNGAPDKQSDAERIARLNRTIEENENQLAELKSTLADEDGEYPKAEAGFKALDEEFQARQGELEELRDQGKADQVAALEAEIQPLQERWNLSKDRFDLAIQERKTRKEQVATLEQKIQQDRSALERLLSPPQPTTQPTGPEQPATAPAQSPTESAAAPEENQSLAGVPATGVPPNGEQLQSTDAVSTDTDQPPSEQVRKAEKRAQVAETEAKVAEDEVESLSGRIEQLRRQIELEGTQLETARKKADNAQETVRTLSEQAQRRSSEGAPQAEQQKLWEQVSDARGRYRVARAEVTQRVDRIDELQSDLGELQNEHIAALQEAEEKREEADKARKKTGWLASPFHPTNLLNWALERGPRILAILIGMAVLLWLSRTLEGRIVRLLVGRAGHGTIVEREDRAKTLVSVFHNAAFVVVIVGGVLMIVTEFGINLVPLLGGAAVVGLAVAFGAQNLIRDYFYGFMILLENQYCINDVVKIGGIGGLVERVTLRVTVLRDLEGTAHFIPNGQITSVSNMTHGWSRALFSIGVAYKEDVDQVMKVLVTLGKELRADPTFRQHILDDPEMLGVDSFDDSAVTIKFFIKTRPLQQWTVKRALLRRIKKKFDELGIEIPFPHRTIFHHYEGTTPPVAPGEIGARPS